RGASIEPPERSAMLSRTMADERRKDARMKITLPLKVNGHDADGTPWMEMSACSDASYNGASFILKHSVEKGQVLLLSVPMPKNLRHYDLNEPSYHTYALVRAVEAKPPNARIAVFFLGRHA